MSGKAINKMFPFKRSLIFLFIWLVGVRCDSDYVVVDVDDAGNVFDKVVQTDEKKSATEVTETKVASTSSSKEAAPEDNLLELIDLELNELDSLISLGQRKVDLLTNMRKHVASGKRLPASIDMSNLEKTLARVNTPPSTYADSRMGVHGSSVGPSSAADLLMIRSDMNYNSTIVASVVVAFKSRGTSKKVGSAPGSYVSVVVLGDALGHVMFMDTDTGTLLHVLTLSDEGGAAGDFVTKFSFEGSSTIESPLLAVGTSQGRVLLLSLTLWQSDVVVAGKKVRVKKDENGNPLPDQEVPQPPAITSPDGLGIAVKLLSTFDVKELERVASAATIKAAMKKSGETVPETDIELPPPPALMGPPGVTALLVYNARGGDTDNRRLVAVGDSTGSLFAVALNGTLLRNATVRQGYARDIKKQGNALAVCEDLGVGFLSLSRFAFTSSFCKGGAAPAESLAVDVLAPSMIYVAFSSGEVVLYNSKAKSTTNKGAVMCSKVQKLNTAAMAPQPFNVHTTRGYVIVGSMRTYDSPEGTEQDDGILIFNSSNIREMGVRFVSKVPSTQVSQTGSACATSSAPLAVSIAPGSMKLPEILVVATSSTRCGEVVTMYEALLSYEPPLTDMSWVRMPMLLGGLAMVFGWQFLKGKSPPGASMFGGRSGRGAASSEEAEIANMMASMGGGGSGGMAGGGLGRGFDSSSARRGRY